ncbi:discoidin domain-containing protein [Cohnella zeiphila]|uniref:Discoidin domain-containing protein n=1 Tax=Cohnella zeiphila TaxID=2761120 RepID=A0A7X0SQQ7_9BACL|nr:discoidin domain-containing protein [Cohnella zeiphila]MBB6734398.1 discoidin domain-containing protein [Cohnella zeiphila]
MNRMNLTSGEYVLTFVKKSSGGYELELEQVSKETRQLLFRQRLPVAAMLKNEAGEPSELAGTYRDCVGDESRLLLTGELRTEAGTMIRIEDTFEAGEEDGTFVCERQVTVVAAGGDIEGFSSRFGMEPERGGALAEYEMFAPGVWYVRNENTVQDAIASDYTHHFFYMREMRLALPFLMMRDPKTGYTLSLGRMDADSRSDADETCSKWLVDESIRYGSLGICGNTAPRLDYLYPGWEGEVNYIDRSEPWVRRSHPVRPGVSHSYRLLLRLERESAGFEEAMSKTWRFYFGKYNPEVKRIDVAKFYGDAIGLLDVYCRDYNGVVGLPFKAQLPDGKVTGHAMVMGFVGQQLPAAYQMLRHGYRNGNEELIRKGCAMVDFWVQRSMTPAGVPKTWYEPYFEGTGIFTNSFVDLRTMADGMEGALDAYLLLKKQGEERVDWLHYVATFGDWLAKCQNGDGSFCRIYDLEGQPTHPGTANTSNPVRFLLRLHEATGEQRYFAAAVRAGEYAYEHTYKRFRYVGGTSDNDNTIDKEAGAMAMNAFLALHDHTGDSKWLKAFQGAADFTETWMFAWDYGLENGGTRWEAGESQLPQWLMVDLERSQSIQTIDISFYPDDMAYEYRIETSLDEEHWNPFEGSCSTRYVKVTVVGMKGSAESGPRVSIRDLIVSGENGENMALGKPTSASSWRNEIYRPDKATDGRGANFRSPVPDRLVGRSLVATGHSYADMYLTYQTAQYYRLYLFTRDEHYLHVALLLKHNVNRLTDWDGTKGYAYPGLIEEGGRVSEFVYGPIDVWLTWCTVAQLEPLSQLEDRFGSSSIDALEKLSWEERVTRNGNSLNNQPES